MCLAEMFGSVSNFVFRSDLIYSVLTLLDFSDRPVMSIWPLSQVDLGVTGALL